jgi:hypothetical protein
MMHTAVIEINRRLKITNEEVFGDDEPCAVLGIRKLSER